jgi:hypothetical protein
MSGQTARYLLLVTGAVALVAAAGTQAARQGPAARVVPDAARPLPLTAVRLTGGPLKHAQDLNARYLLQLEPDRMLAYYRVRAGLEPKAEPYAGWDGDGRNLTGHIAGHYLSGVSLMYAATGNQEFKTRADYIVSELAAVQAKHGDGYLSALANLRAAFAALSRGEIRSANFDLNGEWSPWYTLHKTFAGLRDAYRHAGNRQALEVEARFAAWAEGVLAPLDETQIQRMLATEFGGMNEVLVDLYADTGDRRWLDLSYRFEHRAVMDRLKRRDDPLAGLHGNTQVPKVIGSATRFAYTGDAGDLAAADFFWNQVVYRHSFATGGHGTDEYFGQPGKLGNRVDGRTAETCNVYNMLKLTRKLFALAPAEQYAEFHEQALFNHILGSMDPESGATCYMVPVGRNVTREYQNMERSFTCCVGSGMESHALHGLGLYYESDDKLWVNVFAPSTADWASAGVQLTMETGFPEGEAGSLRLTVREPKRFTLALRRPSWARQGYSAAVNGEPVSRLPRAGSYLDITRTWTTGDVVTFTLPKALHLAPLPDNNRRVAVMWGPLVLAGDMGPEPARGRGGRGAPRVEREPPPVMVAADRPVAEWLEPVAGQAGRFRSSGVGRTQDVEFVPFYRLHRRAYGAYWDLVTPDEWTSIAAAREAERERLRRIEAATVAFVQPGANNLDAQYNLQGENTSIARVAGRGGRRSNTWFSIDLPVESVPMALVVTYHAEARRPRVFDVQVDGRRIAEQLVDDSGEPDFFDVEYAIPPELTRGKQKVTVRFQATSAEGLSPVFGVRMIRR